jgi:acyl carrier protein
MNDPLILAEVNKIFCHVLDNERLVLTRESSAKDVEDWDSLNHIQLVVAIEKHFRLKFTSADIRSWKNVGEMCDAIGKMRAGTGA